MTRETPSQSGIELSLDVFKWQKQGCRISDCSLVDWRCASSQVARGIPHSRLQHVSKVFIPLAKVDRFLSQYCCECLQRLEFHRQENGRRHLVYNKKERRRPEQSVIDG